MTLIEAGLNSGTPDGFQESQRAEPDDIDCILGNIEAHSNVALRSQIVDLIRSQIGEQPRQGTGIT